MTRLQPLSVLGRLSLGVILLSACSEVDPGPDSSGMQGAEATNPLAAFEPDAQVRAGALGAVQTLFDALERGDAQLLRSIMDPTVVMHFTETRDGRTTFGSSTLDGLASRITSSEVPLTERMWSPVVAVSGALATVWTPYDFYVGPTFSHCGVDTAHLLHTEDGWSIVALSWTRLQPPACALHPEGPPAG